MEKSKTKPAWTGCLPFLRSKQKHDGSKSTEASTTSQISSDAESVQIINLEEVCSIGVDIIDSLMEYLKVDYPWFPAACMSEDVFIGRTGWYDFVLRQTCGLASTPSLQTLGLVHSSLQPSLQTCGLS